VASTQEAGDVGFQIMRSLPEDSRILMLYPDYDPRDGNIVEKQGMIVIQSDNIASSEILNIIEIKRTNENSHAA
jgi:hypothetical protein